jgi:hypothetical protein
MAPLDQVGKQEVRLEEVGKQEVKLEEVEVAAEISRDATSQGAISGATPTTEDVRSRPQTVIPRTWCTLHFGKRIPASVRNRPMVVKGPGPYI